MAPVRPGAAGQRLGPPPVDVPGVPRQVLTAPRPGSPAAPGQPQPGEGVTRPLLPQPASPAAQPQTKAEPESESIPASTPTTGRQEKIKRGRRIGFLRPVRIPQVTVWEVALVAVVATVWPFRLVSIIVAAVAVLVIGMSSVRVRGLCAYQWIAVWWRYRRREGERRTTDPLGALLPNLRFQQQIDRAGNKAGLARLGEDWITVVRLAPAGKPDPVELVTVLRATCDRTDIRLSGAELVIWSVPPPPRARYYGDQRDSEPLQVHWLALRYRIAEAPLAAKARGGDEEGAAKAAATAALALVGRLAEVGYAGVVLEEPDLRQDLLVALGSDVGALSGPARPELRIRETWKEWSAGTLRQACFRTRDQRGALEVLGRRLSQSAFTATSHTLRRNGRGDLLGESTVRIGMHPTQPQPDAKQVGKALGVALLPRNGRQERYVRDTLPLALPSR
jgi:type VII secretion protein EccE